MADAQYTADDFDENGGDEELETEEVESVDELGFDDTVTDDADEDEDEDEGTLDTEDEVEDDEVPDDVDEAEEEEESLDILLSRDGAVDDDARLDGDAQVLTRTAGTIAAGEFTCRSCFLVKRRAQLADADRVICLDCA